MARYELKTTDGKTHTMTGIDPDHAIARQNDLTPKTPVTAWRVATGRGSVSELGTRGVIIG